MVEGKTCLITGASDGIGKETAISLATKGAHVIIVGRNQEKCESVVSEIRRNTKNSNVDFLLADLSLMREVSSLAERILYGYRRLDILINNAGAFFRKRELTEEGLERTFALNHLNYFLLTHKLIPLLEHSPSARIINVASMAHLRTDMDFENLNGEKSWSWYSGGWNAYCRSKLANVMFTYKLSKKLNVKKITANCLHPGFVSSKFGNNNGLFSRSIIQTAKFFGAINVKKGSETSTYLASSDEVEGVSGKYFAACSMKKSSRQSHIEKDIEKLWSVSEDFTSEYL